MSARKKRWDIHEPAPPGTLDALGAYSPLVAQLLYQRDLRTADAADAFLSSDYKHGMHDPFLMKDMDVAARRLASAIKDGEPIVVYGDFDADGVTAVTLLMQAISAMGGDIQPYIPHRMREGYGLNHVATETLVNQGTRVLLTVDCGISNVEEVARARAAGLDVIVTDHHTPPAVLPDANAVVNPKQNDCNYPYKQLVGVGIAYKLVQALSRLGLRMPLRGRDLLDVVALGTVTDLGPLTGENRVLVKAGLESINATQRPGLRALIVAAGLALGNVRASDIAFMLGPRLNAAGRLDDAVLAYRLLLAEDATVAQQLAADLNQANTSRQNLTKQVQEAALQQARELGKDANRIVLLDDEAYPAGIVGLVASKLVDELGRPVLLMERGEDVTRGSARSVAGFNMIQALTDCADLFERFGGHAAAAGFTIATERVPELEARLLDYAATHLPEDALPVLKIDAAVSLNDLSWDMLKELSALEPFGQSNPQPVLMSRARVIGAWPRGQEGQHLKLRLDDGAGGPTYEGIAFRLGHLADYFQRPRFIDVAYTFEANTWNGNSTLQLNIKDFRRA